MTKQTKFIVITGGVLSGLGKGIAAASIGFLLKSRYKIVPMKLDGYLNVDPGTMNPIEHGEVFVLDDGAEVDMDFGHYERYLDTTTTKDQNLTMGKIFDEIRFKERRGDYLGKTVQFIPHVTNLIKEKFFEVATKTNADIILIEVGGTVGDIENELYIQAVRQLKSQVGENNICYVHLTYVPIPKGVNEQKSKPTQQSVNMLRERGIQPDIIIARCSEFLEESIKEKISTFSGIDKKAVISGVDVDNVYKIPLIFEEEGICEILHKKLQIYNPPDFAKWKELLNNLDNLKDKEKTSNETQETNKITVAIAGKYTALNDSYASINEALMHASANLKTKVEIKFIETTNLETNQTHTQEILKDIDCVIIPGGFGTRGTEGKIQIIKHCRENHIPILGICLGLQLMVCEYARNICNLNNANSSEINPNTPHKVVDILPDQINITNKGGTMRLGSYEAHVTPNTLTHKLYNSLIIKERHRHRYEVNPQYHDILKQNNLILSATSQDKTLVEFIELTSHPYFIATQAHPELKSKLHRPAPLFYGLIEAAIKRKQNKPTHL